jgi:hypothetical protein
MRALLRLVGAALCGLLACRRDSISPDAKADDLREGLSDRLAGRRGSTVKPATAIPTADDLRRVEQETHLKFPASHRVLFWETGRGIDAYFMMKFEMAAQDWPAFIAASPFREQPLQEGAWSDLGPDEGAWDPGRVPHLRKGQVELPNVRSLNLGADVSRPDVVVVYLFWFET